MLMGWPYDSFDCLLLILCQVLVMLDYFEHDQESLSWSCSRLSLPHSLVSYSYLAQDLFKYPAYLSSHVPWFPSPPNLSEW